MYGKITIAGLLMCGFLLPQGGDKTPRPPQDPTPLPAVRAPEPTAVERRDLLQRFGKPSPLEGFYELQAFTRPGMPSLQSRGYLCIGRHHLSIHLEGSVNGEITALQSAFREYRIVDDRLMMSTLVGFGADPDHTVTVDPPGLVLECSFQKLGTKLLLELVDGTQLEFLRIE